jgi:hypothetical protein
MLVVVVAIVVVVVVVVDAMNVKILLYTNQILIKFEKIISNF